MEQLIPVINKLQDVFNTIGADSLDLPQIVVVGSQSSGKSSVLENIVGRDFLPRGSGIVTRRPLILQLIYLPWNDDTHNEEPSATQEWGEFLHKPNEMFYDFNEIREEIIRETDRLTGKNKGISAQPINLKIYSPHVVNLTLVDLPGITKVPVGDQPSDIETQIRRMIMTYIKKPTCIILAVTPANTDLANSDALQLAREVDPEGVRTIGVITKIDLMDKGTDAMDVLTGKVIPLNLGFIGVINRSQEDILSKKPIREALKAEQVFFKNHALYKTVANKCGTPYLAKTLNKILMHHIRDCLPELKNRVNKLLAEAQLELMSYGDPLYDTKNSQGALLLQIITKFSSDYRDAIDGKLTDLSVHELYGGARINYIFNEIFAQCLNNLDPIDGLTMNDIRTTIRNATGPRAALFIPEVSFELLVKRQISRLEEPSLQCVEYVYDELQRIVSQLDSKELMRFANLRDRVVEVVHHMLQKDRVPTRTMIENLIKVELAFINTNHPDFVGGDGAITSILEKMIAQKQDAPGQPNNPSNPFQNAPTSTTTAQSTQKYQQQAPQPKQPAAKPPMPNGKPYASTPPGSQGVGDSTTPAQGGGFLNMFFGGSASKSQDSGGGPVGVTYSASQPTQNYQPRNEYRSASDRPERLQQMPTSIKAGHDVTDKEKFETELIKSLLVSYFNVVRKNVKDLVPKSIMFFLVTSSKESIQNELVGALYKEELFDELLEESPTISARRKSCAAMIEILRKAHDIINEVRDFSIVK
jgi:replication fork clamp-binding protein CrfC